MRKGIVVSGVVAVTLTVGAAGAALAAGGGFGSPGTTSFHDVSASPGSSTRAAGS